MKNNNNKEYFGGKDSKGKKNGFGIEFDSKGYLYIGFFMNEKPKYPDDHVEYSFDTAPEMEIPSDWNTQINKLFFYEGTIWFKKSFKLIPLLCAKFCAYCFNSAGVFPFIIS